MLHSFQCQSLALLWWNLFLGILFSLTLSYRDLFPSFLECSLLVSRNTADFSGLILCPRTLLNSLTSSYQYVCASLRVFYTEHLVICTKGVFFPLLPHGNALGFYVLLIRPDCTLQDSAVQSWRQRTSVFFFIGGKRSGSHHPICSLGSS